MASYQISRTIVIDAAPSRVFDVIADFGTWTTWSPWLIAEPQAKVTVSQPVAQLGSTYAWEGEVTGSGMLTHQTLEPGRKIVDQLQFLKPFKTTCQTSFDLFPEGKGTRVTWNMDASLPWFLFWMIPMMKTFIGMDYHRGLMMLKEWIETGAIASQSTAHGVEPIGPLRMAGIARSCSVDGVNESMTAAIAEANQEFSRLGLPSRGEMISVYTKFHVKKGVFDYLCGYLIPESTNVPASSKLKTWELPATKAFRVEHVGPYRHLGNGWSVANQIVRYRKMKQQSCGAFEIYRNSPANNPPEALRTDIYLPLR